MAEERNDNLNQQQEEEHHALPALSSLTKQQVLLTGATLVGSELAGYAADLAYHSATHMGLFAGTLATFVVAYNSRSLTKFLVPHNPLDIMDKTKRLLDHVDPVKQVHPNQSPIEKFKRMAHLPSEPPTWPKDTSEDEDVYGANEVQYDEDEETLAPPPMQARGMFTFSTVLQGFKPSLERIYIGTLLDGTHVFCKAEDLCHVALAGSTGGGKSSIMRMLMAQLCTGGAQVLLLNPHYTKYDLKSGEDWTPFEPYLVYDPMECRKYKVIEHYLKYATETLLRKRMDRYAHSLPLGKPYFIVLDELPSIIKHVPDAPGYLSELLREGRKVGIYLISASQDFLVKTIDPSGGGGAVRDCYRTAFYVGGDATTAKIMLDMPPKDIPEYELGKGAVMLRCAMAKVVMKAMRAQVPYVDNEALYKMLGPSTYKPAQGYEMAEEPLPQPGRAPQQYAQPVQETPRPQVRRMEPLQPNPARRVVNVPEEIRTALEVYQTGMGYRDLGRILNYSDGEARALWQVLHQRYRHLLNAPQSRPATTVLDYEDEPQPQQESMRQELRIALNLYKAGHDSYRKLGEAMCIDKDRAGKLIRELQNLGMIEKSLV